MSEVVDSWTEELALRYRIERTPTGELRLLGKGGMASVYAAIDLKHHRKVALKLLRPNVAAVVGAERFLHEIRVTANLQHPHILALLDSGVVTQDAAGAKQTLPYYVMPLVEGESLRDRLTREIQLPVEAALEITKAVASALDYAHRHGVLHRDIKPENILLADGDALIADFGIALALSAAGGARLTYTGIAIGTPHYMSPEQSSGERAVSARADIYALGCVVYEMLAGEPPFTGPTTQAIAAKAATDTPRPLVVGRPTVPTWVDRAVAKALAKLPADRFETAGQFAAALVTPGPSDFHPTDIPASTTGGRRARITRAAAGLAAVMALMIGAGVLGRMSVDRAQRAHERVEFSLEADSNQIDEHYPFPVRISRDGRRIVYVAQTPNGTLLFIRGLSDRQARPIAGTEGASSPAFSPDGDSVAFVVNSTLRKMSVDGGPSVLLAEHLGGPEFFNGLDWGAGGTLVYADGRPTRLFTVSSAAGALPRLIVADSACGYYAPTLPPGGRVILAECDTDPAAELAAVPLFSGTPRRLGIHGGGAHYVAGQLLYADPEGTLRSQRFRPSTLTTEGTAVAIGRVGKGGHSYDVSESGTLVNVVGRDQTRLVVVDQNRSERVLIIGDLAYPRFSPDGTRLAYVKRGGPAIAGIWIHSLKQGTDQRVVADENPFNPAWSPDGHRIVFSSNKLDDWELWIVGTDGMSAAQRLLARPQWQWDAAFTRDGKWIIFAEGGEQSEADIAVMSTKPPVRPEILVKTPAFESEPTVSPNGRWLAYVSNETGTHEVYVRPFKGEGERQLISVGGGDEPVWSGDGRSILYRQGSKLVKATVVAGDSFRVNDRQVLFDRPDDLVRPVQRHYDVSADGSTFAFITNPGVRRIVVTVGALDHK